MQLPISSNDKESLSVRLRRLAIATALFIGVVVAVNGQILLQLRKATIEEVQTALLRQSLTLSELTERTFQSISLVLASIAAKFEDQDLDLGQQEQLKGQNYYLLLRRRKTCNSVIVRAFLLFILLLCRISGLIIINFRPQ